MSHSRGARPSSSPHTTKNWPVQVETDPRQLNLASLSRNGQSVALTPTGVRQGTRALWQASAGPCTGTSHRKSGLCPLSPHPRSPPFTLNSLATAGPPTAGSLPPLVQGSPCWPSAVDGLDKDVVRERFLPPSEARSASQVGVADPSRGAVHGTLALAPHTGIIAEHSLTISPGLRRPVSLSISGAPLSQLERPSCLSCREGLTAGRPRLAATGRQHVSTGDTWPATLSTRALDEPPSVLDLGFLSHLDVHHDTGVLDRDKGPIRGRPSPAPLEPPSIMVSRFAPLRWLGFPVRLIPSWPDVPV